MKFVVLWPCLLRIILLSKLTSDFGCLENMTPMLITFVCPLLLKGIWIPQVNSCPSQKKSYELFNKVRNKRVNSNDNTGRKPQKRNDQMFLPLLVSETVSWCSHSFCGILNKVYLSVEEFLEISREITEPVSEEEKGDRVSAYVS